MNEVLGRGEGCNSVAEHMLSFVRALDLLPSTTSKEKKKKERKKKTPVAHACNSSYSGGRDQEDHGLKPAWANSF
jgi:hypothetical protein